MFTRPACAELLIDAGAVVDPLIWKSVISSRAKGMLRLLLNKGVLPRTLMTLVALADLDGVRACFDESGALRAGPGNADGLATVNQAFMCACRWQHKAAASFLLERCIALDTDLGRRIDGRSAFIEYLVEHPQEFGSPWQTFVMNEVLRSLHEDDLSAFVRWLQREPYLTYARVARFPKGTSRIACRAGRIALSTFFASTNSVGRRISACAGCRLRPG
jgi:hypothetical protein